jgi:hypothetical protein
MEYCQIRLTVEQIGELLELDASERVLRMRVVHDTQPQQLMLALEGIGDEPPEGCEHDFALRTLPVTIGPCYESRVAIQIAS